MNENKVRECYAKIERESRKTGKTYIQWAFIGWYEPCGEYIKSTKQFDYYKQGDGIYKYRKN